MGELSVASFLVNYFKRAPFPGTCGCVPLPGCTLKVPLLIAAAAELAVYPTILRPPSLVGQEISVQGNRSVSAAVLKVQPGRGAQLQASGNRLVPSPPARNVGPRRWWVPKNASSANQ